MYDSNTFDGIVMTLTLKKGEETLTLDYDFNRWDHPIFEDGTHLGRVTMRELFKDGWVCVERKVKT